MSEGKEVVKSKSLGTLNRRGTAHPTDGRLPHDVDLARVPVQQTRSYPLLTCVTIDSEFEEKRVRFTPVNTTHTHSPPQGEVQSGDESLQNFMTSREGDENSKQALPPSIATRSADLTSPSRDVMATPLLSSTPRREVESESHLSNSFDFGSISNAGHLPLTASAASGGEDILGVSALSGDYYSLSVDPNDAEEREGRLSVLSQHSNVLPEDFESDSLTDLDLHVAVQLEGSVKGVYDHETTWPVHSTTPTSSSLSINGAHQNGSLLNGMETSLLAKPKNLSVHDLPGQHNSDRRRSSLFSSSQYGSIVSAAQSTSISVVGSEQLDSEASTSPSPRSTPHTSSGRDLVPLATPRDSINVLLQRGADPNLSPLPMPPLFYAIKACDLEAVQMLLKCGANTEICLPIEVCELLQARATP